VKFATSRRSLRRRVGSSQAAASPLDMRLLTVKLRGRMTRPDTRRGRTLVSGARGADTQAVHGPLQRLLGSRPTSVTSHSDQHAIRVMWVRQ